MAWAGGLPTTPPVVRPWPTIVTDFRLFRVRSHRLCTTGDIAKRLKQIREAKGLTAKEVISAVDMGAAMYSRIENGKTEPSLSTLEKTAKSLGVSLSDFFATEDAIADVTSYDGSLMEKVKTIEALSDEE